MKALKRITRGGGRVILFSAIASAAIALLSILPGGCRARKTNFVTIGTGAVTGIYYPTGGAISQMINAKYDTYGIKATVESTSGSVFNINSVLNGDLEFGVAQSDRQYQAYKGLAEWADSGPQGKLRSVFSIHPESITLVVSVESGINDLAGLKGQRINLGNPGSGQLGNSTDLMEAVGIDEDELSAEYVKAVEAPGLLQDGRLDGFFFTVGHPNGNITEATSGRIKVKIVPITGPEVDELCRKLPYYSKSVIPQSLYPAAVNDSDIETVGVKTTLVTSADVSDEVVYAITREVFENLEHFKTLHPAYASLTRQGMLSGLFAPIHPGALKYYREAGLDEHIKAELIAE